MKMPLPGRRGLIGLVTTAAALVACSSAWAHAEVSPPVALAGAGQVFTLAVPTEEEDATTTTIELTPPEGFDIDSFVDAPGWKRTVDEGAPASGEDHGTVEKVTWTGGDVPHEEATSFMFLADPSDATTYTFKVRQTYSNGTVVDWSGAEDSDTPAPTIEAVSSFGGSGGTSTVAWIALVLGALGLIVGGAALLSGKGGRSLT